MSADLTACIAVPPRAEPLLKATLESLAGVVEDRVVVYSEGADLEGAIIRALAEAAGRWRLALVAGDVVGGEVGDLVSAASVVPRGPDVGLVSLVGAQPGFGALLLARPAGWERVHTGPAFLLPKVQVERRGLSLPAQFHDAESVVVRLRRHLADNPGDPVTHDQLGQVLASLGHWQAAVRHWQEFLRLCQRFNWWPGQTIAAIARLMSAEIRLGHPAEVDRLAQAYSLFLPIGADLWLLRAMAALQQGRLEAAREALGECLAVAANPLGVPHRSSETMPLASRIGLLLAERLGDGQARAAWRERQHDQVGQSAFPDPAQLPAERPRTAIALYVPEPTAHLSACLTEADRTADEILLVQGRLDATDRSLALAFGARPCLAASRDVAVIAEQARALATSSRLMVVEVATNLRE